MNHASEWMKFFDERDGRYHYKNKGSGVVRDTLMAIGKGFAKTATQSVKKAVEKAAAQAAEKVAAQTAAKVAEKGGKKIQQLLQARRRTSSRRSLSPAGRDVEVESNHG